VSAVETLRSEIATHKAEIRRRRALLRKAAAALRAECARLGIKFVVVGEGEETTHGRNQAPPRPRS
jgi:radical SAM superfamily enzyme YgiQ (UPF0313 family)